MCPRPSRRALCAAACFVALAIAALAGWRSLYASWQIRTARALLNQGGTERVESALHRLQAAQDVESPARPELLYLLGRASRRAGRIENAFEYLRGAERLGWPAEEVRQQIDLALIQRARFEDAESRLQKLLSRGASDELAYEVYEALAKGYMHAYRFDEAIACLDFWIKWCPQAIDARLWRASIWEQIEGWKEANGEYRAVLQIDPAHRGARVALAGNLLLRLNEVEAARQEFELCLQSCPADPDVLLGIAACERRLGNAGSAERRLRSLLSHALDPKRRAGVELELGQVLLEKREFSEAILLLKRVIEIDPLNGAAHHALGVAYSADRQPEVAQVHFEKSRVLTQQYGRLVDITTQLVSHPDQVDLRWEAGQILMEQGLEREGAAWMSTALMFDPNHRKTHEALAHYYETVRPDSRLAKHHRSRTRRAANPALN